MDSRIFDVASAAMGREQLRIRQAVNNIAAANTQGDVAAFSNTAELGEAANKHQQPAVQASPSNTMTDLTTIMIASRSYEANVSVISAARAAFEKALEISGRR